MMLILTGNGEHQLLQLLLPIFFFRDFPDLDQIVFDGAIDNNHLLKVITFRSLLKRPVDFWFQLARMSHRMQPETESVIKMIMDTPFVVSFWSLSQNILSQ